MKYKCMDIYLFSANLITLQKEAIKKQKARWSIITNHPFKYTSTQNKFPSKSLFPDYCLPLPKPSHWLPPATNLV